MLVCKSAVSLPLSAGLSEQSRASTLDTVRELVGVVSWLLSLLWEKAMTLKGEVEANGIDDDEGSGPLMGLDEGWCEDEGRTTGMARTICMGRDERDVKESP